MRRGHIPYRGEVRPKQRGHPSPPDPNQRLKTQTFWFLFAIAGIVIAFFAIKLVLKGDFGGFFAFVIYLIFLLIAFFAFRDAKQIETQTQDQDEENDDPTLLDDYLAQIEWRRTPHRSHRSEPKWRYHPTLLRGSTKDFGLFVVLPVTIPIFGLAYFYGANSPITVTISIAIGLVGTCVFLMIQNSRN
jgi:cell division protein FtsW (lipid II flippase)